MHKDRLLLCLSCSSMAPWCACVQAVSGVLLQRGGDAEASVGTGSGQSNQERQENSQAKVLRVTLVALFLYIHMHAAVGRLQQQRVCMLC